MSNSVLGFTVFSCSFSCVFLHSRSDSDSEGENPEKKKLQEQLMGEWEYMDSIIPHGCESNPVDVCAIVIIL